VRFTTLNLVYSFLGSMFVGIIIISIGLGAALPVIEQISAPIVCPGSKLQLQSDYYYPRPGETDITRTYYCAKTPGEVTKDITFKVMLVAGVEFGLILFVIIADYSLVHTIIHRAKVGQPEPETAPEDPELHQMEEFEKEEVRSRMAGFSEEKPDAYTRLEELRRMYDSNLITAEEYASKKSEILRGL
jgi:hypothetical protein